MIANQMKPDVATLFAAAIGLRPTEELYDIRTDPSCLNNLATAPEYQAVRQELWKQLKTYLVSTGDLRVTAPESANLWEMYPRYSSLRWFPEPEWWSEQDKRVPVQPWLEERRPR